MPTAEQLRKRERERDREDQELAASEKELKKEDKRAARKKLLAESITNVTIKSESYIVTPDGVVPHPLPGINTQGH